MMACLPQAGAKRRVLFAAWGGCDNTLCIALLHHGQLHTTENTPKPLLVADTFLHHMHHSAYQTPA